MDTDIDINGDDDIGRWVEKVKWENLGSKGNVIKVVGDKVKARFDNLDLECRMQDKNAFVLLRANVEEENISPIDSWFD